jgi:SAM-dependent methyltransferase
MKHHNSGAAMNACQVCGNQTSTAGTRDGYHYRRCSACSHLFVTNLPSPEKLRDVYARYSYDVSHLAALPPVVLQRAGEIADDLAPFRRTGRVLDVGFGAGTILKAFSDRGWEAHGVETSTLAVEQARANGLRLAIEGDFLNLTLDAGSFDAVFMFELIEHLPDPRPFIERALTLLRPGGLLYLTTPNGSGLSGRLMGTAWSVARPPEHLNLFSPESIRRLVREVGFAHVQVHAHGTNPYEILHYLRKSTRSRAPEASGTKNGADTETFDRVGTAYALNRRLHGSQIGRAFKHTVNTLFDLSRLGDNLKVRAVRTH